MDIVQREHPQILAGIGVGWGKLSIFKISNGHISGTGRPIDFVFDPRVAYQVEGGPKKLDNF